jgi:uncharacterized protein
MAVYYFDTSALVKRYRAEKGTAIIDEILGDPLLQDRFFTSFLTILEVTSSITRLVRAAQLTEKISIEIFSRFRQDIHDYVRILPLDNDIAGQAVSVVERFGLRSADAIHMATAIYLFATFPIQERVMVSSDQELLQAAKTSNNMIALNPESEGATDILRKLRTET